MKELIRTVACIYMALLQTTIALHYYHDTLAQLFRYLF